MKRNLFRWLGLCLVIALVVTGLTFVGLHASADPVEHVVTLYVSESGNDANTGLTSDSPKKTLGNLFDNVIPHLDVDGDGNEDATTRTAALVTGNNTVDYPAGTRIVIKVSGSVYTGKTSQIFCNFRNAVMEAGSTTKRIPIAIEKADGAASATVNLEFSSTNDLAACVYTYNDLTFKDLTLNGSAASNGVHRFWACPGASLTFDGVTFTTSNAVGWKISADFYYRGPGSLDYDGTAETHSTVTLKNGGYTGLAEVSCVSAASLLGDNGESAVTNPAGMHCTLVIGSGATVGTVYNRAGTMNVGESTVIIDGTATTYVGIKTGGTSSSALKYYTGDLGFVLNSTGSVTSYNNIPAFTDLTGNVSFTRNGGTLTNQVMGLVSGWNAAKDYIIVHGDVHNTITGGSFNSWMSSGTNGSHCSITGTIYNTVSGGTFPGSFYGGSNNGSINGEIITQISGGNFNGNAHGGNGDGTITGDVTTTISGTATFKAGFGFYGTGYKGTVSGTVTNNINGGTFNGTFAGGNRTYNNATEGGSTAAIVNTVTAGQFNGAFYGGSQSKAVTNGITNTVSGGSFASTFGGGSAAGTVSGGITVTVTGGSFSNVFSCGSWAGTVNGGVTATVSDTTSTPTFTKSFCASQSATINDGVTVTINEGTFAEYTCIGINSGTGTIAGGITTTVNGGSFGAADNVKNFYVGNVGNGAVTGNVTTVVNGGTFTGGFYNGNAGTGAMNGHLSLTINNATGIMGAVYGGPYNGASTVSDGVELTITKLSQTANSEVVAGSRLGAVNQGTADYAVKLLIDPEKASDVTITGDVALGNHASGSSNTGIITGEVYGEIRNGTQAAGKKLILGNIQYGIIHGNVTLRHSGGTFGQGGVYVGTFVEDAYVSNRTTETEGDVTYIIQTSKRTPKVSTITTSGRGTYTGDSRRMAVLDCTPGDEGTGNTAQIHGTACYTENLDVKVIGGSGEFTITHNDNAVNANLADMTGGAFGVRLYSTPVAGDHGHTVITLPDVGKDGIDLNAKAVGSNPVQALIYNKADVGTYVVFCLTPIGSDGASLILRDRISARIYLNKADLDGWMDLMDGDWYYTYTFNGETVDGTIVKNTSASATPNGGENEGYYFDIPVNAAYMDKDITFTCPGISATFSLNRLINTGIDLYDTADPNYVVLLKAIYNYGLAAKDMFTDEEVTDEPKTGTPSPYVAPANARVFQYTKGGEDKMHFAGTNLKLEDQVQLQIYINYVDTKDYSDLTTFKLGGEALTEGEDYTLTLLDSDYIAYLETQGLTANAVFNLRLNANEMTAQRTVTAVYDGVDADTFTTKISDHCAIYIDNDPTYTALCRALLVYMDLAAAYPF